MEDEGIDLCQMFGPSDTVPKVRMVPNDALDLLPGNWKYIIRHLWASNPDVHIAGE